MSMQAAARPNHDGSEKKSTEPETEKNPPSASRFNAVKHGLTAKTPVLPNEDEAAYLDKVDAYKESLQTRNALEDDLAELAAEASWQLARAKRSAKARAIRDRPANPALTVLRGVAAQAAHAGRPARRGR